MTNLCLSKATDEQLWTIVSDDWYCPKELLEQVVNELLKRKRFDHLIKHLINKMFDRWDNERRYNFYDLFSLGYIGIINALKNYQEGKGSFKTFAYMNIKTEFGHHLDKVNSEKRRVYRDSLSLDIQKHDDNEITYADSLVDDNQNVEKQVITKLFWDESFNYVSEQEKDVMVMFAKGYSFQEIARIKGYSGAAFISRLFHRGAVKINPQYVKKSLKDLGLMTRTKERIS